MMQSYREEILSSVLACVRVPTLTETIRLVNAHEFGNGVACYARDGGVERDFTRRIQVGIVGINVPSTFQWRGMVSEGGRKACLATYMSTAERTFGFLPGRKASCSDDRAVWA